MEISLTKTLNGTFKPTYDSDYEAAKKIKVGEEQIFKTTKQRNPKFHRKFFALINMVFQNQERFNNMEILRKELIIEAGYYTEYTDLHGTVQKSAHSISFSNMDEYEFNTVYNKVLDVVCLHFHFDKEDIQENIAAFF
jgi:hypothetical protein